MVGVGGGRGRGRLGEESSGDGGGAGEEACAASEQEATRKESDRTSDGGFKGGTVRNAGGTGRRGGIEV